MVKNKGRVYDAACRRHLNILSSVYGLVISLCNHPVNWSLKYLLIKLFFYYKCRWWVLFKFLILLISTPKKIKCLNKWLFFLLIFMPGGQAKDSKSLYKIVCVHISTKCTSSISWLMFRFSFSFTGRWKWSWGRKSISGAEFGTEKIKKIGNCRLVWNICKSYNSNYSFSL